MFGRGGGEFILPFLISIVALPFFDIATISLFLIFSQAVIMLCVYGAKHKLVDWPLAFSLALIVGCSAFFGGFLSFHVKPLYLKGTFAIILLISAWKIWQGKTVPANRGRFGVWHRKMPDDEYDMNFLYILIPVGAVAFVAGMLGITGGGLYIPICVILGCVPLRIAIGTNTMLVLASSGSGLLGHLLRGGFYWKLAFIFAIATVIGALLGSRTHADISEKNVTRGFVAIVVIAAIWMVVKIYI
ncbi:MAG: sulfite exporter TauE/SafE family protein [Deltaproteobacteria bacterium]|nr:sulfite exporter TauE/SafE family protein [Deltaproteobacteria bacterium]MBW2311375.1 sulfite exporter TauE/SafE family protein [Deltaproteobacteria bacterium]